MILVVHLRQWNFSFAINQVYFSFGIKPVFRSRKTCLDLLNKGEYWEKKVVNLYRSTSLMHQSLSQSMCTVSTSKLSGMISKQLESDHRQEASNLQATSTAKTRKAKKQGPLPHCRGQGGGGSLDRPKAVINGTYLILGRYPKTSSNSIICRVCPALPFTSRKNSRCAHPARQALASTEGVNQPDNYRKSNQQLFSTAERAYFTRLRPKLRT